jgi:hypothetical protein
MHIIKVKNGHAILPESNEYKCCINIKNPRQEGIDWVACQPKYQIECSITGSTIIPDILSMPTDSIFCITLDINFSRHNMMGDQLYVVGAQKDIYSSKTINDLFSTTGYVIEMITEAFKINFDAKGNMHWTWDLVNAHNLTIIK